MAKKYNIDDLKALKPATLYSAKLRVTQEPADYSSLFSNLNDAKKYAKGDNNDPDARGLQATSYAGQVIGVRETETSDTYDGYIIQGDGELKKMGGVNVEVVTELPANPDSGTLYIITE